jgi:putative endonuclease
MSSQKFYVYIVHTQQDKYYTGVAIDPDKRVKEHNSGKRGAKALRGQRPVILVWKTPVALSRSNALKVEKRIKKLPRAEKLKLMQTDFEMEQKGNRHNAGDGKAQEQKEA